jgi:hypothetical protein
MFITKYKKIFSDWRAQKDFSKMDIKTFSKIPPPKASLSEFNLIALLTI